MERHAQGGPAGRDSLRNRDAGLGPDSAFDKDSASARPDASLEAMGWYAPLEEQHCPCSPTVLTAWQSLCSGAHGYNRSRVLLVWYDQLISWRPAHIQRKPHMCRAAGLEDEIR